MTILCFQTDKSSIYVPDRIGVGETGDAGVRNGSDVFVSGDNVMTVWCDLVSTDTDHALSLDACLWYRPHTDR